MHYRGAAEAMSGLQRAGALTLALSQREFRGGQYLIEWSRPNPPPPFPRREEGRGSQSAIEHPLSALGEGAGGGVLVGTYENCPPLNPEGEGTGGRSCCLLA